MSTFSRLTLIAQYDDMCRLVNKLIKDAAEEEDAIIRMLTTLQKKWISREQAFDKEKNDLKDVTNGFQKEIKKLTRQLEESRKALDREFKEKKKVAEEKRVLMEQIEKVKELVLSSESQETDAHKRRVIKYLDVGRLPAIQSEVSQDSDDCCSLEYDKTEEDIIDTMSRQPRRSRNALQSDAFLDVLENLPATEQPTILCRYLNKNSDDDQDPGFEQQSRRRTTRRAATTTVTHQQMADLQARSTSSTRAKQLYDTESDCNGIPSDNDIERCREQLKQMEEKSREKLAASACSTPNMKGLNRAATLNAKSTASLMKINSNLNGPATPSVMRSHKFVTKKNFAAGDCRSCQFKLAFCSNVARCEICGIRCHPECKDKCSEACVKNVVVEKKSGQKKLLIKDYVNNNDTGPKVPALIVHCCDEIERGEKIRTPGLYRVAEYHKQIEELFDKIKSSKSGIPNISNVDVHVLTGVVKRFLQHLDETLITTSLWGNFAEATKLETEVESLIRMEYYIINNLPAANRDTLSYLMQHLHAIDRNSKYNNMTFKDLAKALAPTIVGNSCRDPSSEILKIEAKTQIQILETLLKFKLDFWEQIVQKIRTTNEPQSRGTTATNEHQSRGSRLLNNTPRSNANESHGRILRSSRLGTTLPTPKMKSLFSG